MAQFILSVVVILIVLLGVLLPACMYLIFLERKIAAWVQDRTGPNRTNFSFGLFNFKSKHLGLGQAVADGLKLFIKEDYTPPNVERVLFILAPVIAVGAAMLGWAVIPWGGRIIWGDEVLLVAGDHLDLGAGGEGRGGDGEVLAVEPEVLGRGAEVDVDVHRAGEGLGGGVDVDLEAVVARARVGREAQTGNGGRGRPGHGLRGRRGRREWDGLGGAAAAGERQG